MPKNIHERFDDLDSRQSEILNLLNEMRGSANESNEKDENLIRYNKIRASGPAVYCINKSNDEYGKIRDIFMKKLGITMGVMLFATLFVSVILGFYSTFTLFENIWLIFVIKQFSYSIRGECILEETKYLKRNAYTAKLLEPACYVPETLKTRYIVWPIVATIGAALNVIIIFSDGFKFTDLVAVLAEAGVIFFTWLSMMAIIHYYDNFDHAIFNYSNRATGVDEYIMVSIFSGKSWYLNVN